MPKTKRKSKIEYKAEAFATRYIANNFNGSKTIQDLSPNIKTSLSARVRASEALAKPIFQTKIQEAMQRAGLTNDFIAEVTKRNIKQSENYSASNSAMDMVHRIEGNYAPEKKTNLNLNLTVEQAEQELKDLLNAI